MRLTKYHVTYFFKSWTNLLKQIFMYFLPGEMGNESEISRLSKSEVTSPKGVNENMRL